MCGSASPGALRALARLLLCFDLVQKWSSVWKPSLSAASDASGSVESGMTGSTSSSGLAQVVSSTKEIDLEPEQCRPDVRRG